ncbi:unnamed protein product [Gongylonema pulchrum]|uniref:Uncharacterized protein n=1 Tax=Gongylonema pulchrum TaxID=637853 RepID=A0A183DS53_9BILA|nr:unnamed protein product [Gongylonema pulchrum]
MFPGRLRWMRTSRLHWVRDAHQSVELDPRCAPVGRAGSAMRSRRSSWTHGALPSVELDPRCAPVGRAGSAMRSRRLRSILRQKLLLECRNKRNCARDSLTVVGSTEHQILPGGTVRLVGKKLGAALSYFKAARADLLLRRGDFGPYRFPKNVDDFWVGLYVFLLFYAACYRRIGIKAAASCFSAENARERQQKIAENAGLLPNNTGLRVRTVLVFATAVRYGV